MSSEVITLVSSAWSPLVTSGLYELYKEKIGFNVAIYGSTGGILDAHACVLMAVSPTLKTWLAGDPIQGCHSVEINSITCDTWTLLLEFIYAGTASVSRDALDDVYSAAENLQLHLLMDACREKMADDTTESDAQPTTISQQTRVTKASCTSIMPLSGESKYKLSSSSNGSHGGGSHRVAEVTSAMSAMSAEAEKAEDEKSWSDDSGNGSVNQPTGGEIKSETKREPRNQPSNESRGGEQPLDLTKALTSKL